MKLTALTVSTVIAVLVLPPLAAAGPTAPDRAPVEHLAGTELTLTPQIGYESAVLKVVGPGGYQTVQPYVHGEPIRIDLQTASIEHAVGTGLAVDDGQYRYELFLDYADGERTVFQGLFYVDGGVSVSRSELRSRIASLLGELTRTSRSSVAPRTATSVEAGTHGEISASGYTTNDFLKALDDVNDGTTYLTLHSDDQYGDTLGYWHIFTDDGDLKFDREVALGGVPGGTNGLTLDYDSGSQQMRVGIGTTAPTNALDITANFPIILEGDVALGSSRTIKHEIEALDAEGVLTALRELPVYAWKYRDDPNQAPHIGPMAEDVHDAFGVGRDEKQLSPADTAGLALAAIQGMGARMDQELKELRARNTDLAAENRVFRQRLEAIEKLVAESTP